MNRQTCLVSISNLYFFCYSLTFKHESQNLNIFISWLIRILCAHMNRKSKALCPFRVAVDAIKCFTEISYFFNLSRAQGILINYLINESGRFTDRILWLLVTKSFLNIQYCSNIMFLVVDFSPDLLKKYSTKIHITRETVHRHEVIDKYGKRRTYQNTIRQQKNILKIRQTGKYIENQTNINIY